MFIDTALIEDLIFKRFPRFPTNRFTQDSPIYPDVWLEYYNHRKTLNTFRADLILTPHRNSSAAELFRQLSQRLMRAETRQYSDLATNGESVVVKLTFHEMLTLALPMTNWWQKYLLTEDGKETEDYEWLSYIVNTIDFSAVYDNRSYETQTELEKALEEISRRKDWFKVNSNQSKPLALWSINRNRKASVSVYNSVPATKADSCRRLFDVDGAGIVWAVLDSGIDARHMAFRLLGKDGKPLEPEMGKKDDPNSNNTRVVATYDFSKFRSTLVKIHDGLEIDVVGSGDNDTGLPKKQIGEYLDDVQHALENGRILDWSVLSPLIRVPHNEAQYIAPKNSHGTHVAGILGANIDEGNGRSMRGMCPGIKLYDLRVFDERGEGEEFNIMAAIQFVRWLNNQKDVQAIHGVNMSISMTHDVASYACGQTPVCVACNRLVAEGTVVVAAAGNLGQTMYKSKEGSEAQGFRMVNITDPGNAEKVITVGATHRDQPHAYGVSYFSSKGPTGDGRLKPDLVAPGEKIISTMVDQGIDRMDGTSMAAPHVSGAAALILSRHRELIGKPEKVKQIICAAATDLGREKYFQGCGMLDVLRAVQSI